MDEERREAVIRRVLAGHLAVDDAAMVLGISERSVWRLRARFFGAGRAGLAHGNRGRAPANRIEPALVRRIVSLASGRYAGMNDSHLAEMLKERERIDLSRKSVQRILRAAGIQSPRRHRAPRYRSRRERRPATGMLLQLDGSRHRWLGPTLPYLTLVAIQDDATSEVLGACFREQEDAAGYFSVLAAVLERRGVPLAVYSDRHGIFWRSTRVRETIEEELAGEARSTQLGRALGELGIRCGPAHTQRLSGTVGLTGSLTDLLTESLTYNTKTPRYVVCATLRSRPLGSSSVDHEFTTRSMVTTVSTALSAP